MRVFLSFAAICLLAACDPPVPDSGAGVGFDNANLSPNAGQPNAPLSASTALPPAQSVSEETLAVLNATAPAQASGDSGLVVDASPSNPAPVQVTTAGISDENDFEAVDSRRSIEDDAKRRAEIAAQYQQIEAQDLPDAEDGIGPNIVEYALLSSNPLGKQKYRRLGLNAAMRFDRNCRKYPSADQAQIDFLTRGGPERDRLGLDPDGDGYACSWDPTPFQKLRSQ